MIDWLTKQISKYKSFNNNNKKEVNESKQKEVDSSRETIITITSERTKEFIILMIISSKGMLCITINQMNSLAEIVVCNYITKRQTKNKWIIFVNLIKRL